MKFSQTSSCYQLYDQCTDMRLALVFLARVHKSILLWIGQKYPRWCPGIFFGPRDGNSVLESDSSHMCHLWAWRFLGSQNLNYQPVQTSLQVSNSSLEAKMHLALSLSSEPIHGLGLRIIRPFPIRGTHRCYMNTY